MIELLTVMAMLGIVFTAAFFFYSTTLGRTEDTQARRNALSDQRIALDRIIRELREAQSVDSPSAGEAADAIELTVLDAAGSTSAVTIDCSSGDTCVRRTAGIADELLIDDLEPAANAVFTVGADGDYVYVQLESLPEGRTRPIVLSQGAALRNCAQNAAAAEDCRV